MTIQIHIRGRPYDTTTVVSTADDMIEFLREVDLSRSPPPANDASQYEYEEEVSKSI